MGVEQRKEFYKVCRVAFELVCNGLTPYNLNSGDVYIKNLGRLQSDDLRVRKIITRILNSPKETPGKRRRNMMSTTIVGAHAQTFFAMVCT